MASQYSAPGPGPSNHYLEQRSPPLNMMYLTNGAGPSSFPYQYGVPPMHSMPLPPINDRGRGSYSHHAARGATHNPAAYHTPYQPYPPHSPQPHPNSIPQHPRQSPNPGYAYLPPHQAYSAHAWQPEQPLSPLPKQLSMPPPSVPTVVSSTPAPPPVSIVTESVALSTPDVLSLPTPTSPTPREASRPPSPTQSASSSTSESHQPFVAPQWVIWSRRPNDPASAPGIIFSPRSKPPARIVREAMQILPPVEPVHEPPAPLEQEEPEQESSASSTVPSSETAYTPTIPGSPISSQTSVSVSGSPSRSVKPDDELPIADESRTTVAEEIPIAPVATPTPPKKSWASLLRPAGGAHTKNALPRSTIVGFSIPAVAPPQVSSTKMNALHTLLTAGSTAPVPPLIPRGLVNTGNMCFANSVLQILVHCPPFLKIFHELGKLGEIGNEAPLVRATVHFLNEFIAKSRKVDERDDDESFIPAGIYDAMKEKKQFDNMRGGHQEDAEEFLGFYLDTLEEELLAMLAPQETAPVIEEHEEDAPPVDDGWLEVGKKNRTVVTRTIKASESPITKIFGGKARSTLRAPGQKDSVVVEDWRSLRLDIQPETVNTVQDAVRHIADPQTIQRGVGQGDASQQVLLEALPSILILHIKRFHFDTTVGDVVKIGKRIAFGPELEIGPDTMAPTLKRTTKYKLFGVVYHHGASASGGHYTLDVLHTAADKRDRWMRIDDELVSDVRREDVFDAFDDESRTAYLLFYRRIR